MKEIWLFLAVASVAVAAAIVIGNMDTNDFSNHEINLGDIYLYSNDWNPENPFEETTIDTVVVLAIKEGYVKYILYYEGGNMERSRGISRFKDKIRNIE